MPADPPILELRSVTHRFRKRTALERLTLAVPAGAVIGLLGPNGAGKTTVISLVAGLTAPTEGAVLWRGAALPYPLPHDARRRLGLLPQETALYGELTARENLRFTADLFGIDRPEARVAELLELVGLRDRTGDRVGTFSGGMQRRLAFARALVHDPELLVLDEPTLGVDVDARHVLWGHIRRLRRLGRTVLLTTNYLDEAEALCDEVVALREGRCIGRGTPANLLHAAGRCVEIDCQDDDVVAVGARVGSLAGVGRLEVHDMGLTVHLTPHTAPDDVATAALDTGIVHGVRVRAPDMAEVLDALAAAHG
ncbi:MAG TPA: ABC transporter ATP-binding protein [Acidimicrobiales bacterium]|nr:ABC transporter ATP-binding protein [Acidimicrobiales bacterium]